MRLCHVIESAGGGAGQVVIDLVEYGVKAGDDITVICSPTRAEPNFVETISGIGGVKLVFSRMQRKIGLHDFVDGFCLLLALRRLGPFDIIHAHSSKAGALVRLVGLFLPRSIKIYTAHGFITLAPQASPAYRWIERLLSFFCSAIIVVSRGEQKHALSIGLPATKVKLIPNGTSIKNQWPRQQARQYFNIPDNEIALGFVGRMENPKNPVMAIEAFAETVREYPYLILHMIGDGSLLADAKDAIHRHNLHDKVRMWGYRNGRQLMAAFDALVCSSDYETLPITFLEALKAGVPIITRQVPGIEEAIIEGKTGFLATSASAKGLAEAMKAFASTPRDQRHKMRDGVRIHACQFTQERMGALTRTLYEDLLS